MEFWGYGVGRFVLPGPEGVWKRVLMGRLQRKRPISSKKKGRKKAEKENDQPQVTKETEAVQEVPEKEPEPKIVVAPKKEVPKPIKPAGRTFDLSFWAKGAQFLREVKIELKKVTWPSRKETVASTVVVIIVVMIVSAFLGLVDMGLSSLIGLVLH